MFGLLERSSVKISFVRPRTKRYFMRVLAMSELSVESFDAWLDPLFATNIRELVPGFTEAKEDHGLATSVPTSTHSLLPPILKDEWFLRFIREQSFAAGFN